MKVLMMVSSLDSYRPGPDGFIVDWVRVLANKIDHLTILTYHLNKKEKFPKNVNIVLIDGKNFISRNLDLAIKALFLASKNDVIFAHILEVFGVFAAIVGKVTRRKSFFWYCQGYDLSKHYLAKLSLFLVDYIFTSTSEIKTRYIQQVGQFIEDKTIIVGHGINIDHYD